LSTLGSKQVEENPSKKETHGLWKIIHLTSELHKGCNFDPSVVLHSTMGQDIHCHIF
jgi:hypothetical protein